ncbi:hypothetical protein BDR22DRAFT_397289 [Usnea florida]
MRPPPRQVAPRLTSSPFYPPPFPQILKPNSYNDPQTHAPSAPTKPLPHRILLRKDITRHLYTLTPGSTPNYQKFHHQSFRRPQHHT